MRVAVCTSAACPLVKFVCAFFYMKITNADMHAHNYVATYE